jgi:glycosyltransferase involved in cell wall biosynthesis
VLPHYVKWWGADVLLTLYDPWAFPAGLREAVGVPWLCYTPIDGSPVPGHLARTLRECDYLIAYSRFGQQQLEQVRLLADYIPHMIDTEVFKPLDKQQVREELGFPQDAFVASVVAVNKDVLPSRKSWPQILEAWAQAVPQLTKPVLYCHSTKRPMADPRGFGFEFNPYVESLGIPHETLAWPDQMHYAVGVDDAEMAKVYSASDVVLLPSMSEGFGLPIIEAQACGTPVITLDAHTGPELTDYGIVTRRSGRQWIPGRNYYWSRPDVEQIKCALLATQRYYQEEEPETILAKQEQGRGFVLENYSLDVVQPQWVDYLEYVGGGLW